MNSIGLQQIKEIITSEQQHFILDCRAAADFDQGFIEGSIFAGSQLTKVIRLAGIKPEDSLYILAPGTGSTIVEGLQKQGFGQVQLIEQLDDATKLSQYDLFDLMITIEPDEFAMDLPFEEKARIIDLREEEIFSKGHVEGAEHIDMDELTDIGTIAEFEEHENVYLYGDDEAASFIGSLMKRQGVHNFKKVTGTFADLKSIESIKIEVTAKTTKED